MLAHVAGSPVNVSFLARLAISTLLLNSAFAGEPVSPHFFLSGCSNSI